MRKFLFLTGYFCLAASLIAATAASAQTTEPSPSISATVDKSADPCADFFQYSCGNWLKTNEIPPDQSRWNSFNEVAERNRVILHEILEKAAVEKAGRDAIDQKIGDYYSSCMDENTVDAKGLDPLKPELERLRAVKDKSALIQIIARDHLYGTNTFFDFGSDADLHNAGMDIAVIDQSGLTLPDRDYYLKEDAHMTELRKSLVEYVTKIFTLSGETPQEAANSAKSVLKIETALAKASMDRTERRDPKNLDHKMTRGQAVALAPTFYLDQYFTAVGSPSFTEMNVVNPDFFKQVNSVVADEPLSALKTYAEWHLLNESTPWLSKPYVEANFKYRQALTGQKVDQPRWKRCVASTDRALGEALGQRYVELTFGAEGKQRMQKMVAALEKSLAADIQNLDWMSDATKKEAKVKLDAITNKIGYPDQWRDYSSLEIVRGDMLGNFLRSNEFESKRQIVKIGHPVDRKEWGMTPPTVNAYYNPALNEIVFPAGILQPPFFDKNMDDAVNFGGIGLVIGHELTHGFDDEGRKFDPEGNLRDWWTAEDGEKFEQRASCIVKEYGNFVSIDDLKLNGKLTLGENTADNGGARVSLAALKFVNQQEPGGKAAQTIDGYTPDQRFFLGFGRVWCEKRRPEAARMAVTTDPHSPGKYRVDGVVQNLSDFQTAWNCKAGQPMVSQNACHVW